MFTARDQQSLHYALWATQFPRPDHVSVDSADQFSGLDAVTAQRAAFFTAVARHGVPQGLQNQFLPEALTLEPYHPYLAREVPQRLAAIGLGDLDATQALVAGGFDVLHVPLLRSYGADIFDVFERGGGHGQDLLVDPAYGYCYALKPDRLEFLPLALSHWAQRLIARKPQDVSLQYLSEAAGGPEGAAALLKAGVEEGPFIGGLLFEKIGLHIDPPNALPEMPVANEEEFNTMVGGLTAAARLVGGLRLWFRGQTSEYPIVPVTGLAKGPRSRPRPSLVPGVFRKLSERTDELDKYRELVLQFGRWSYRAMTQLPLPTESPPGTPSVGFGMTFESRRTYFDKDGQPVRQETKTFPTAHTELSHGLILQHYGAPTGYIDITTDPRIGLWFALNRLDKGRYQPHAWDSDDPRGWPVVYVMALIEGVHPFIDSTVLWRNTDSLRPQRQKCGLLGGSGNLFRNFPGCFVSTVFRLKPGFKVSQSPTTAELFPGPDEDPFLARLLADESAIQSRSPGAPLFPVTVYS